jgi:RNA polymerase sigma-70 factor (subfamily 1)
MGASHEQLLDNAIGGDTLAMQELLERHGPAVRACIAEQIGRQWRSVLDARDVMQVTYLEAFSQIEGLTSRDPAGFTAWLTRMAERNLQDAIRTLKRSKRPQPENRLRGPANEDSYVGLLELLGTTSTTPSRQAAHHEAAEIVETALGKLPVDYATVVRLYDLEGGSPSEVAEHMGRSVGAVHMLRHRAHDRLRRLLGSASKFFSDTP